MATNAKLRPSDRRVETRNPKTCLVGGFLDGRGCEWFAPRSDPVGPPFPEPAEPPYPPMGSMKPMARPLPPIRTREQMGFDDVEYR